MDFKKKKRNIIYKLKSSDLSEEKKAVGYNTFMEKNNLFNLAGLARVLQQSQHHYS